jgi:hypothetical protein
MGRPATLGESLHTTMPNDDFWTVWKSLHHIASVWTKGTFPALCYPNFADIWQFQKIDIAKLNN